jgi:hypothetical protein
MNAETTVVKTAEEMEKWLEGNGFPLLIEVETAGAVPYVAFLKVCDRAGFESELLPLLRGASAGGGARLTRARPSAGAPSAEWRLVGPAGSPHADMVRRFSLEGRSLEAAMRMAEKVMLDFLEDENPPQDGSAH